jgi:hypothetical protein
LAQTSGVAAVGDEASSPAAAGTTAGIEPFRRIYDLRHTFATFALRAVMSTFDLPATSAPA